MTQEEKIQHQAKGRARKEEKADRANMTQEEKSQVHQAGGRERKERQRANMTQEEKSQDQAKGRARKKADRPNMTQEEREQDFEDELVQLALGEPLDPKTGHSSFRRPCFQRGEAREKSQFPAGPTFPPETWQKDLIEPACIAYVPDARARRARNYASEMEDKAARQAAAGKKLRDASCSKWPVSELPPPEDWPDITQCPVSAKFTFMVNSGCWRFADSNRLPRETDQEGVTNPR